MKRIIQLALIGVLTVACGSSAFAQQKFGYINKQEVITLIAERDSISVKINKLYEDYGLQFELIQVEFNQKLEQYQKEQATYSDAIKQLKNKELQDLQTRAQQLETAAQQEVQQTYEILMNPIIERVDNAVKKVGADGGYVAIFDESTGAMAYYNDKSMTNVMAAVKRELGL